VKSANRGGGSASSFTVSARDDTVRGDVVYLLAELCSVERGPVHEIGARARVLGADGDRLTIAVASGNGEDILTCPRGFVARRRQPLPRRPRFACPDLSPAA
jgi:hypothetical protein